MTNADDGNDNEDAVEMYIDALTGKPRRRRGHVRRIRRGPYSLEEKNMINAFDLLLSTERRMDGELAQYTCRDIAVLLTGLRLACERYSYENFPDVSGLDPHVIMSEVGMELPVVDEPADDVDIYKDLR